MLAEFVGTLEEMSRRANAVDVVTVKELPGKVFVRHGHELTAHDVPPPKRGHILRSFVDLLELAADATIATKPHVFHSDKEVVVLLDSETRAETVSMPLAQTERFAVLAGMAKSGWTGNVAEAVKLMRFKLNGIGCEPIIAALRKIDFTRKGTGENSVAHGKETFGRSVEAAVQQADQVPDTFAVELPIYSNDGLRGLRVTVRCGIYLDVQNERIAIYPLADEIQSALEVAQNEIHSIVQRRLKDVPVFNGEARLV